MKSLRKKPEMNDQKNGTERPGKTSQILFHFCESSLKKV